MTNIQLDHRTGTEIVVRDLEAGLRARGHQVSVYTPNPGVLGDEITAAGGTVVSDLARVPFVPDVIHGHHSGPTAEAALHFAGTPVVFVCHSRHYWLDMSRGVPSVHEYVAVDRNCLERLAAEGAPDHHTHLIPNAVDLTRFVQRASVSRSLDRAAVFGNNAADGGFVETVRHACAARGLPLDEFGSGVGKTLTEPERRLCEYDVVFAKARCAIEAIAAGCAVIVIDEAGYGGLVTAGNVEWMLDWNLGDRCLQRRHDVATIDADLSRIDPEDIGLVCAAVRARCSLDVALDAYEHVYSRAVAHQRLAMSPPANSWRDSYDAVVSYATDLEARLRAGEGAWSMPPLPPASTRAIGLALSNPPRWIEPETDFRVDVEIVNRSRENLATAGSTPVQLSYHWLDEDGAVVHFEGRRTALTAEVRAGVTHHQAMVVRSPAAAGRLTLHATLVQEHVAWFSDVFGPCCAEAPVSVTTSTAFGTLAELADVCGLVVVRDAPVSDLGFISSASPGMLSFAVSDSLAAVAISGGCSALIVPPGIGYRLPDHVGLIESDAPAQTFWEMHEALAARTDVYGADADTRIHRGAVVHPTAIVDPQNVCIDEGAIVGAGCIITGRVMVERGARILPGTVIGTGGLQTTRMNERLVEYTHVGGVRIAEGAVVFANCTIARGLFRQTTLIGPSSRIGNNAFISHNVEVGTASTIGHGTVVNGNVRIGDEVWVGPGSTIANNVAIGDRATIDLGSTIIGTVKKGEHVGGPPAIDHHIVFREVASWRRRHRR